MATFIVGPKSKAWWQGFDLSGQLREGSLEIGVESLDKTAWGHTMRQSRAGLCTTAFSFAGFQDFTDVDPRLSADLGIDDAIVTLGSLVNEEGDILYSAKGLATSYSPIQGAVGDLATFALAGEGSGAWFRGKLLAEKALRDASGESDGLELGVVATTKRMHATLHVFAVSGDSPTLDVIIESDETTGFSSATTRMTFPQVSAPGAYMLGPIAGPGGSDDCWRAAWTIGGSSDPDFTFAVVFGHDLHG
jgi:hypothetical protein